MAKKMATKVAKKVAKKSQLNSYICSTTRPHCHHKNYFGVDTCDEPFYTIDVIDLYMNEHYVHDHHIFSVLFMNFL